MKGLLTLCIPLCLMGQSPLRWYRAQQIPPARESNSPGLQGIMRSGNAYLSLRDAIALAIENDLDIEIERYSPLLADWALKRAEAGGPLRGVPSGSAQVSAVDSGLGANGSAAAAGLGGGGGSSGGGNGGGATVEQIGQVTPNLDPNLQNATAFSHVTQPQANTINSGTSELVEGRHIYNTVFQQGLISGGIVRVTSYEQHLNENAPFDVLNPAVGPYLDLYFRHSLLQGFGVKLNDRFIRIAKLNVTGAHENLRSRILDTVAGVINLYWDLTSANDELKARQQALEIANKFLEDTQSQIRIGSLARIELPRAQAEVAARQLDLDIARAKASEQENRMKAAISRSPDPALEAASIIPLDHIEVPADDNLPPLRELVATAMSKRPDMAVAAIRDQTLQMAALGTENPLLPSLTVTADIKNRGSAGTYQPSSGGTPNPKFIGGYGTALGQIARRDFPSESAQISFSIPFGNRSSQADYGIDQLQLKQSAISGKRELNAIVVAISNEVIALRQAHAKYSVAVNTRDLQQQLLTAEQQKFSFGKSTTSNVIIAQRALVTAQTSEVNALSAYGHARAALDQVLGLTLEVNKVVAQ